jgi:hypothetical protein
MLPTIKLRLLRGEQIEGVTQRLFWRAIVIVGILAATIGCIAALEMLDGIGRLVGPAFSILWCLGLALWSLSAIRSHQSRFRMSTILCITAIIAVGLSGFAGRFIALGITGLAMILDLGVQQVGSRTKLYYARRTIQVLAGVTCVAHASRVIGRFLLN